VSLSGRHPTFVLYINFIFYTYKIISSGTKDHMKEQYCAFRSFSIEDRSIKIFYMNVCMQNRYRAIQNYYTTKYYTCLFYFKVSTGILFKSAERFLGCLRVLSHCLMPMFLALMKRMCNVYVGIMKRWH